jgi:hypothetical protein
MVADPVLQLDHILPQPFSLQQMRAVAGLEKQTVMSIDRRKALLDQQAPRLARGCHPFARHGSNISHRGA